MSRPSPRPIKWEPNQRRTHADEVERAIELGFKPADILILKALSHGLTRTEAGEILGFNVHYVGERLRYMRRELGAKNSAHLVVIALRTGMIR